VEQIEPPGENGANGLYGRIIDIGIDAGAAAHDLI
jgi:hypothetical protein